jgi:hypothetical protein
MHDVLICQHLLHRLKRPEDHTVTDADQETGATCRRVLL